MDEINVRHQMGTASTGHLSLRSPRNLFISTGGATGSVF